MMEKIFNDQEVNHFLLFLKDSFAYDFTNYSLVSIKRRLSNVLMKFSLKNLNQLKTFLIQSPDKITAFLDNLTVSYTEMFRDATFFKALQADVLPYLQSFPYLTIWHAGCSTGEEVYSMAIMLTELNLYNRSKIYGTDINHSSIEKAKSGILSYGNIQSSTSNYYKFGGKSSFSDYYVAKYGYAKIKNSLMKNIFFSRHDFISSSFISNVNLILCRNVLIYFNNKLKKSVLTCFEKSCARNGYFCLGLKESLYLNSSTLGFKEIDPINKIYKKII